MNRLNRPLRTNRNLVYSGNAGRGASLSASELGVSFEFFPPKNDAMEASLWSCVERLAPLSPDFVSVTYGAGGSTRERTLSTLGKIVKETSLRPAGHLTCVAASKADVDAVIQGYHDIGVRHIVALRGDPPTGVGTRYEPHPDGYQSSIDLVAAIKRVGDFEVTVSAYPERHPESVDWHADIDMLKRKVDAGADRAITQFFFDNELFERYLERVRRAGIYIPIVPGIVPVHNFVQVANFAAAVAAEQVMDLIDRGITDYHFYTMNRADLVYAICHLLGLRPHQPAALAVEAA